MSENEVRSMETAFAQRMDDHRKHMDERFAALTQVVVDLVVKVEALTAQIHTAEITSSKNDAMVVAADERLAYRVNKIEEWQSSVNKQLIAIVLFVFMVTATYFMQQFFANAARGSDYEPSSRTTSQGRAVTNSRASLAGGQ